MAFAQRYVAVALALICLATTGLAETCGVASLFDVCQLAGRDLSKEQRQEMVEAYPAEESSMLDIKQAAEKLEDRVYAGEAEQVAGEVAGLIETARRLHAEAIAYVRAQAQ